MPKKNGPQKSSMFHQSKERHFACAAERLHIEKSPIYRCSIVLTRGGCAMLDDGMGLSLIDVSPNFSSTELWRVMPIWGLRGPLEVKPQP